MEEEEVSENEDRGHDLIREPMGSIGKRYNRPSSATFYRGPIAHSFSDDSPSNILLVCISNRLIDFFQELVLHRADHGDGFKSVKPPPWTMESQLVEAVRVVVGAKDSISVGIVLES